MPFDDKSQGYLEKGYALSLSHPFVTKSFCLPLHMLLTGLTRRQGEAMRLHCRERSHGVSVGRLCRDGISLIAD